MIQDLIVTINNHVEKNNSYINWLFQKQQDFVILKQYVNKAENITKMFIAIPVRVRKFEHSKLNLFNPNIFNIPTFPFKEENIKEHKTMYSGNIFEFRDIVHLLGTVRVNSKIHRCEQITLYKDYTATREEQINKYSLLDIGSNPLYSVNSIYRLLHTKYVTIVEIKFNNINSYES